MISKHVKYITEKVLTKSSPSRKLLGESLTIDNGNMLFPITCQAIEAKNLIPGDLIILESGKMFNINSLEMNEGKLSINMIDENNCETINIVEESDVIGLLDNVLSGELNEDGKSIEIYEDSKKKVKLNKIMRGDVKKYKVFVKNDKGNVVKVNFGDPNMEIKRDNPARRRNFRARHNCDNPGPRWKARYWACKTWSSKPVTAMLKESKEVSVDTKQIKNDLSNHTLHSLSESYNPDLFGLIQNRTK
jgi:hypothetical protein